MNARNFQKMIEARWAEGKFLCIGLDSDLAKIPEAAQGADTRETLVTFNRAIIGATKDRVCAYKFNSAFYEAHGDEGFDALRQSIADINELEPHIPVILDAKRGDIANTNKQYAWAAFEHLRADAVTVQPYQGGEALAPFLENPDKGIFVWCRSSNEGAGEFQDLLIDGKPLYQHVATHVARDWNEKKNCGVVVGATAPEELKQVRSIVGDMPILIPGVGAQNGDLEKTVRNGKNSKGAGMLIGAARAVIFASDGPDFAQAARAKAVELHDAIKKAL